MKLSEKGSSGRRQQLVKKSPDIVGLRKEYKAA